LEVQTEFRYMRVSIHHQMVHLIRFSFHSPSEFDPPSRFNQLLTKGCHFFRIGALQHSSSDNWRSAVARTWNLKWPSLTSRIKG